MDGVWVVVGLWPFTPGTAEDPFPAGRGRPDRAAAPGAPGLPWGGTGADGDPGVGVTAGLWFVVPAPDLAGLGAGGGLGARGAAGTGNDLPAAATRTSPVTQIGVWSLELE